MRLGILAAGLALLMVAPAVVAVHGEAYDAYGTATIGNSVWLAAVHWSGYNGCWGGSGPCNMFNVIIKDLSGNLVSTESFPGCWTANGPVFYSTELLAYHAWAAASTGSCSPGDAAHFDITGFQWQEVTNGGQNKALMYYTGTYNAYSLQLVVPYTVPVPI
ncbi:MAG: hypothetical protein LC624_01590 [Halobacteriales archaeon]|nr:hypothetical protein [Halobacteriales archaeon]